ncbi:MAG: branched-chain amino acid ABC transporter substrate-binding protein [Anaerolineae bacterium]|nr:branched-chain amino acid ABC transporter substrate-binding protein [Anaerolineae bacterium]
MKRLLVVLSVLAIVAVLGVAVMPVGAQDCMDEIGCVEIGPDDPITIAYMLTVSGGTSFLGLDSAGAVEVAVDDRGGELLGHEIAVVEEDSLCSAEGGQTAAQRVAANPQVLGVIGTNCSSAATSALPIISEAGMLMISPSNTSPTLTEADADLGGVWEPGYYRTAHNDLFQGAIAAEFAYTILGKTKLATVHDGSPYADNLQAVMADTFAELGGEVVFQGAVNVGDTDMSAILTEIASAGADIIYYPIFEPESDFFTAQSADTPGLEDVTLMSADGTFVDSFPENTGPSSVVVFLSGPYVAESEDYDAFLERWDEVVGGVPPSGFHAHAYDATNILFNAIEEVAVVADDGSISIGRQALRDAITNLTDYAGLTGTLSCDATGDCATGEALAVFEITQAELDGNWPPPVVWRPGMDAMMAPEM